MIPVKTLQNRQNWKHTTFLILLIQGYCGRRRKLYCAVTSIILTRTERNHKLCIKRKQCNLPGFFINY